MALIKCSECGKEVSEKAAACPSCGNPISASNSSEVQRVSIESAPVLTTQSTGKGPKGVQLVGILLMAAGPVSCVLSPTGNIFSVIAFFLLGLCIYFAGSIAAWWRHG
jgi:uncharacterized OB-fold protein